MQAALRRHIAFRLPYLFTIALYGSISGFAQSLPDKAYVTGSSVSEAFNAIAPQDSHTMQLDQFSDTADHAVGTSASLPDTYVNTSAHGTFGKGFGVGSIKLNSLREDTPNLAPSAYSYASLSWVDVITPTSAVLPAGTPVDFSALILITGISTADGLYTTADARQRMQLTGPASFGFAAGSAKFVEVLGSGGAIGTISAFIGEPFAIESEFLLQIRGGVPSGDPSYHAATITYLHSSLFGFAPKDSSFSYTTLSGVTYATSVPEAQTYALLAIWLLFLMRRRSTSGSVLRQLVHKNFKRYLGQSFGSGMTY